MLLGVPSARRPAPAARPPSVAAAAPSEPRAPGGQAPLRSDRRSAVVRGAYQLIAERGLEGLRFADVARQAGINNGTLLYYFASKDALIQAVGAYLVEQFSATSRPSEARAPLDPLAELRWEFADARARLHDQLAVVYTELLARAQRDPAVADLLRGIDAAWQRWLTGILERGRAAGVFRADVDVELVTLTMMSVIRGVGMQALVVREPTALESVMDAAAALVERWVTAGASSG